MSRKRVLIFIYRPFDLRQLLNTGVIAEAARYVHVGLVVPGALTGELEVAAGDGVDVFPLAYDTHKVAGGSIEAGSRLRDRLRQLVLRVFEITYAVGPRGEVNGSGIVQRRSFLQRARALPWRARLVWRLMVLLSSLAARSRRLRRAMQRLVAWSTDERAHDALFERWGGDLVVVASPGLSADGKVICEARRRGIPTVAVMQSWDKTSSKGYPPVAPDSMIVWSDVMCREAEQFLDMPPGSVFVEGAPVWDHYFQAGAGGVRAAFAASYGLDADARTVYISLGLPAFHAGNMEVIRALVEARRAGLLGTGVNLLFRLHPNYLTFEREYAELSGFWQQYATDPGVVFSVPQSSGDSGTVYIRKEDNDTLAAILRWCDVAITIASSQIIEAAIFERPIVDVSFGRYINQLHDVPMRELSFEHLLRLYATGAVYRCFSSEEMVAKLRHALDCPQELASQRRALVEQELPVNRGSAARAVARRMVVLAGARP